MLCAVISLFFISKPDGQKLLNPATIQQDIVQATQQLKTQLANINIGALINSNAFADINNDTETVTLYRWQDKQGQWHFSNDINQAPAADKTTAETIIITANSSLVTAQKQTAPLSPPTTAPNLNQAAQQPATNSMPALPLTKALDTLQDAKNIQALIDNHSQQLDSSIKNIGK